MGRCGSESLRQTGLTVNLKKCAVGWWKVQYLGYQLEGRQVAHLQSKIERGDDISRWHSRIQCKSIMTMFSQNKYEEDI